MRKPKINYDQLLTAMAGVLATNECQGVTPPRFFFLGDREWKVWSACPHERNKRHDLHHYLWRGHLVEIQVAHCYMPTAFYIGHGFTGF